LPAILKTLQRIIQLFDENQIDYMIIGGYALPFYGRIRTTVDLDLAVAVKTQAKHHALIKLLRAADFEPTIHSPNNPLILVVDRKEHIELELWTKPDGIDFNNETLQRRQKAKLSDDLSAWVVSPEDFVISKLARPDRGAVDEQDVKSVLIRQSNNLDYHYIEKRAKETGVLTILNIIQRSEE
jgi:hypothetical protein